MKPEWVCLCCGRKYDLDEEQCMVTVNGRQGCINDNCPVNDSWKELGFKMVIKDVLITLEVDDKAWIGIKSKNKWAVRMRNGELYSASDLGHAVSMIGDFSSDYKDNISGRESPSRPITDGDESG